MLTLNPQLPKQYTFKSHDPMFLLQSKIMRQRLRNNPITGHADRKTAAIAPMSAAAAAASTTESTTVAGHSPNTIDMRFARAPDSRGTVEQK